MSQYFSGPKSLEGRVKNELDLSNYATKTELRYATRVTSRFAWKFDLANLNTDVVKLDIDKLKIYTI